MRNKPDLPPPSHCLLDEDVVEDLTNKTCPLDTALPTPCTVHCGSDSIMKVRFFTTPSSAKALKKNKKKKRWDAKSEQYCAWCFAEETFTLHGLERIQRIRPQCDISSCTPEWCWLIVFTVLYNFQHPGCFISIFKVWDVFLFFQGLSFLVLFETAHLLLIVYCWCQFAFKRIPHFNLLPMNELQDGSGIGKSFLSETFPSRVRGGYDHFRGVEGL